MRALIPFRSAATLKGNSMSDTQSNEAKAAEAKERARQTGDDLKDAVNQTSEDIGRRTKDTKEDLEAQIARLREDVAGVTESLRSLATGSATTARAQAYALRDDVKQTGERYYRQAQEAASDLEQEISDRVRAEPIKAVLIAAAVGYFYARIFKN